MWISPKIPEGSTPIPSLFSRSEMSTLPYCDFNPDLDSLRQLEIPTLKCARSPKPQTPCKFGALLPHPSTLLPSSSNPLWNQLTACVDMRNLRQDMRIMRVRDICIQWFCKLYKSFDLFLWKLQSAESVRVSTRKVRKKLPFQCQYALLSQNLSASTENPLQSRKKERSHSLLSQSCHLAVQST